MFTEQAESFVTSDLSCLNEIYSLQRQMATNNLEIFRKYSRKAEYRKTYSSSRCRYSKYGCCCYRLENFKDKLIVGTVKHNEHS